MRIKHWSTKHWAIAILLAFPMAAQADEIPARDIAGGHDSPIVSRFTGSVMIGYRAVDFDEMQLPAGKIDNNGHLATTMADGRITETAYVAPAGKSALEVFMNYQNALAQAGFASRFTCHGNDGCGDGYGMANAIVTNDMLTSMADGAQTHNLMIDTLYAPGGNAYVETAHLDRPQGAVDVVLLVSGADNEPVGVYVGVVEAKPMTQNQVTIDAKAMSQGLQANGHIALYGIHFATDSATLTPDSGNTLDQMATLMKTQPTLKIFIVGHTDDTGTLPHNLELSQARAASVVQALTSRGIASGRLAAKGLASYAPVASNADDAGRALNRRVELVAQ